MIAAIDRRRSGRVEGEAEKHQAAHPIDRIVDRLNRTYGIRDFTVDGAYASPLNFYRAASHNGRLPTFDAPPGMVPPGQPVYVIHGDFYAGFIERNNLAVLYRGPVSRVAVAVPQRGAIPPLPVSP